MPNFVYGTFLKEFTIMNKITWLKNHKNIDNFIWEIKNLQERQQVIDTLNQYHKHIHKLFIVINLPMETNNDKIKVLEIHAKLKLSLKHIDTNIFFVSKANTYENIYKLIRKNMYVYTQSFSLPKIRCVFNIAMFTIIMYLMLRLWSNEIMIMHKMQDNTEKIDQLHLDTHKLIQDMANKIDTQNIQIQQLQSCESQHPFCSQFQ